MADDQAADAGHLPDLSKLAGAPKSILLTGEALLTAQRLMRRLGLNSEKDVVYAGLALLRDAEGKEIVLRDQDSLTEQIIPLGWR